MLEALLLSDLHEPPDQALGHNPPPEHSRTLPLLHLRAQLLLADIQLAYSASSAARQVYQQIESKVRSLEDPTLLTELYALDSKLRRAEGDPQGVFAACSHMGITNSFWFRGS